jgi:tetratricopeptide (TPR) repeat protein
MGDMSGAPTRSPEEARALLDEQLDELASRGEALGDDGRYAVAAWRLMHAFEFEAAELAWAATLAGDPRSLEAVFQRGLCLLELGRFDDAAQAFRDAIALDAELRDDPNAEQVDWIEDDPSYRLGNCLHAAGDLESAIAAYEESARRNTVAGDALREIVRVRLAQGRPRDALDALDRLAGRRASVAQQAEMQALRADAERMLRDAGGG